MLAYSRGFGEVKIITFSACLRTLRVSVFVNTNLWRPRGDHLQTVAYSRGFCVYFLRLRTLDVLPKGCACASGQKWRTLGESVKVGKNNKSEKTTKFVAYSWGFRKMLSFNTKYENVAYPRGCYHFYVNVMIYTLACSTKDNKKRQKIANPRRGTRLLLRP